MPQDVIKNGKNNDLAISGGYSWVRYEIRKIRSLKEKGTVKESLAKQTIISSSQENYIHAQGSAL